MIFDGLHQIDDPGLLPHAERLALGRSIDLAVRRRDAQPERWMGWCWRCLWISIGVAALCAIALG